MMTDGRGEFAGRVGQQVAEHLDDASPVRHHQGQAGRDVDGEVLPAPGVGEITLRPAHQHCHRRGTARWPAFESGA